MQIRTGSIVLKAIFITFLVLLTGFSSDIIAEESVSRQRQINHPEDRARQHRRPHGGNNRVRTIDGSGNNLDDTEMGASFIELLRIVDPDYGDGISTLAGEGRPSARAVSNAVSLQEESIPNTLGASDFLWQWGQFVDHDIDLTEGTDPPESANIEVPIGDPFFDPDGTGTEVIELNRSIYNESSGTGTDNPRQQLNEISAWIDASNVYGSDEERANALRTNDGTGKLKTSEGNLLPFNTEGLPNAGGPSDTLFLAGDVRANEQVALTAMHTLFVREHNRLAEEYASQHPNWDGEQIYQKAREIVGAQMQVITYNEYLPALLGRRALSRYRGYDSEVNARIGNLFSAAAYRYGHSALSPTILRLDSDGNEIAEGNLSLSEAFFAPFRITDQGGVEPVLRGLSAQLCQRVDPLVVDDVRNFLFGEPGSGGFDLVSLNIQRGRDHGLPGYNDVREALGLTRAKDFEDVSSDSEIQDRLSSVYESVDDIDIWAGGLSEDTLLNSHVGELFYTVIVMQFEDLRDGDRFWYGRTLSNDDIRKVERTKLSDIIRRNTNIDREIPDDVFHVRDGSGAPN
ncbi:MAG: peroxidase family protein, partial [Candidatus Dadabacteria bacterium]|nr:peroxidase family protein [Candidatus Dadabacteria bacterium]